MCFVMRSRLSGQFSSALTANVCLNDWGVGRGRAGAHGNPAAFAAESNAVSTAFTPNGFLHKETKM